MDSTQTGIADTGGNSWVTPSTHPALYLADGGTFDGNLAVSYSFHCGATASDTITSTWSDEGTFYEVMFSSEISGIRNTSDPYRTANGAIYTGGSATLPTIGLTGTVVNDFVYGLVTSNDGQSDPGSGFTLITDGAGSGSLTEWATASGTSTTVTGGDSDTPWNIVGVALMPAGSAPTDAIFFAADF
jgi:hypothetical protein